MLNSYAKLIGFNWIILSDYMIIEKTEKNNSKISQKRMLFGGFSFSLLQKYND